MSKEIYDEVKRRAAVAKYGGYGYITSSNLQELTNKSGGLAPRGMGGETEQYVPPSSNFNNHVQAVRSGEKSWRNRESIFQSNSDGSYYMDARRFHPNYEKEPIQSTNYANSMGYTRGLNREDIDALFHVAVPNRKKDHLYDEETEEALEAGSNWNANDELVQKPKDQDKYIHTLDWDAEAELTPEGNIDLTNRQAVEDLRNEKKEVYEENIEYYESIIPDSIEAAKDWEKHGYGKNLASTELAIAYLNGYMSGEEERALTSEQLYVIEAWGRMSCIRDMMYDYIVAYGENGKFNWNNLKRIDAAMDKYVEYDPRTTERISYHIKELWYGMGEAFEGVERWWKFFQLECSKATLKDTKDCYTQEEYDAELSELNRMQEDALSEDSRYPGLRAQNAKKYIASMHDIQLSTLSNGLGKMLPGIAMSYLPGGAAITAIYTGVNTAGNVMKEAWDASGIRQEDIPEGGLIGPDGEKLGITAQEAFGYGSLVGLVDGLASYGSAKLFNPAKRDGLGNRVVNRISKTKGGRLLLDTFIGAATDTSFDMVSTIFHRIMKNKYDPNSEFFTEAEFTDALFSSLFINTTLHGVQNIMTNAKGWDDDGLNAGDEQKMFGMLGAESDVLEAPKPMRLEEPDIDNLTANQEKGIMDTIASNNGVQAAEDDALKKAVSSALTEGEIGLAGQGREGIIETAGDYKNYTQQIGLDPDLDVSEKVARIQEAYHRTTQKDDLLCPIGPEYVGGFDDRGRIAYSWADERGFAKGYQPIDRNNAPMAAQLDRVGSLDGANFSIVPEGRGPYSNSERGVPYLENPAAYHKGSIDVNYYYDALDAIADKDLNRLNQLLGERGMNEMQEAEFKRLLNQYDYYNNNVLSDLHLEHGSARYGITGYAKPWGKLVGGAPQYTTPLTGTVMKNLGIIKTWR